MVYRMMCGGVSSRTEQKPSVYSLISDLERTEDGPERIFFAPEDEISMSIEYYNPVR